MSHKIRVLLVDDHAVVRAGYKAYLSLADTVGEIFEADKGELACQLYTQCKPDIVVLDMSMPGIGGLETIRRLKARDAACKILVFSIHDEIVFVERAIEAGAKGYIIKSSAPDILITAVDKIANGGEFVDATLAAKIIFLQGSESERLKALSPREFDVFCLLIKGQTAKQIAVNLCLSYKTVANYSTGLKEKLAVNSIAEMTLMASRQGMINFEFKI